mmetsp:Transcript_2890/g.3892  ORF Transcript_2890/g.3892 Transcript_2890/m.3892 type:complete len:105 (+) Transcript_2890:643-957(+)
MTKSVMHANNKKIAFLTFKIVEETIKRVCLKNEIAKLMPVQITTVRTIKKQLMESTVFQMVDRGSLILPRTTEEISMAQSQTNNVGKKSSTARSFDLYAGDMQQ